jgi:hypothetical protein
MNTELQTYSFTEDDINLITFSVRRLSETTGFKDQKMQAVDLLRYIEMQKKERKAQEWDKAVKEAMQHCFSTEPHNDEKRYWFDNEDAADTVSESLKHLWDEGLGQVYGPFCNYEVVEEAPHRWWEVSYK